MASPFDLFRKHQKVLMVALTGLAMFAFIIFDQAQSNPELLPVAFGLLIGAALFWSIGSQRGHGLTFAIAGGVLGMACGFFLPRMIGRADVVESSYGDLSGQELYDLIQQRQRANEFVRRARSASLGFPIDNYFGPASEDGVVGTWVWHERAEEMGINLGTDGVFEFIRQMTGDRLSEEVFSEIRRDLRVSESQLVELLAYELEARMALDLKLPFQIQPRSMFGMQLPPMPLDHATPAEYWEIYRRMTVEQQIAAAEVPVEAFIDRTVKPPTEKLAELFEQYKLRYPNPQTGDPGFRQPPKVQIAFLKAGFEATRQEVPPPTEEEMRAYYEEGKAQGRYTKASGNPFDLQFEDEPVEAPLPASAGPPAAPAIEGAPPAGPAEEEAPAAPPTDSAPADESESEGSCGPPEDEPPASAAPEEPTETEEPSAVEAPAPAPPSESSAPPAGAAQNDPAPPPPFGAEVETPEAKVEYRPFEEVQEQIREELHNQKVNARLDEIMTAAMTRMSRLGQEYRGVDSTMTPKEVSAQLEQYAEEHGLRYVVTPLWTADEFMEQDRYDIKFARDPSANPFGGGGRDLLSRLYGDERDLSYAPTQVVGSAGDRFAVWKTQYVPEQVPETLEEVEEQVKEAWWMEQARPKARERAEELAKGVKKGQNLGEALAGKTVTGEEGGKPLVVTESRPFSWLTPRSLGQNLGQGIQVELTDLPMIEQEGREFMQTVFEELEVGETGVAANTLQNKLYVVQVTSRDENPEVLRQRFLAEEQPFGRFMSEAYQSVLLEQQFNLNYQARQQWDQQAEVQLMRPAAE